MYFAEIENGIVKRVIVAEQDFIDSGLVGDPKNWIETDMAGTNRKNYAGPGFTYDSLLDAFIPPKLYDSWVLDEQTCQYKAPLEKPLDTKIYTWNESELKWDLSNFIIE